MINNKYILKKDISQKDMEEYGQNFLKAFCSLVMTIHANASESCAFTAIQQ